MQPTATATAGHPLVGAWRVEPAPPGPPLAVIVYHADGTLVYSAPAPAPPGAPQPTTDHTPAYGVWEATGERSAALTATLVETDATGRVLGTVTFHGSVELDETLDAYTYRGVAEAADPSGAVVSARPSGTRATRLRVDRARATAGAPAPDPG